MSNRDQSASDSRPTASLLDEVIGQRFLIKERLDATGRADVYRAEHVLIHQEVALKVARIGSEPDEKNVARFQRVARVATQIEHPNCVKISDFGTDERGYVYLAMEFSEGRDLRRILAEDGPLTPEEVVGIGLQILQGLGEAHRRGILHTELAPHYVMVDLATGTPAVKLLGFGLGQLMRGLEEATQARRALTGAPAIYAAPEVLQPVAAVDHRADLFAVGAVLFEALTGELPWEGAQEDPAKRLSESPRRASRVRPDGQITMALDRALARAMEPDPNRRFGDTADMAEALDRSIHGDPRDVSTVASLHRKFGRYKLLRTIARGGMGELHLASSETLPGLTKVCALKMLRPELAGDKSYVDRFLAEARMAAQLSHANLATVYDVGKAEDCFYMAMEYVIGKDCRRILDRAKEDGIRIPIEVALFIARELADALGYAHRVKLPDGGIGLIHRDVSPTNVLVSYEGLVKLIDFGLAKHATAVGKTETGVVIGKVAYMAPEQCLCEPLDHRCDIYSVGSVLFELLTGTRLREGDDIERLAAKVRLPPERLPGEIRNDVPPDIDRVVARALAPDPDDRYPHAEGLRDDITQVLSSINPRFSRDTAAAFLKQLFPAEQQAETELAQGLLTQSPPLRPASAIFAAVDAGPAAAAAGAAAMKKTEAISIVNPADWPMDAAATVVATGPALALDPEEDTQVETVDVTGMDPEPADDDLFGEPAAAADKAAAPDEPTVMTPARPARGPGWGVALVLLVLGVGAGFAVRHLVLKNLGGEQPPPGATQGMQPGAAPSAAAAMPPGMIPAMRPEPVRPVVRPRPQPMAPPVEELMRRANAKNIARVVKLADAALLEVGVRPTDLPALRKLAKRYQSITGAAEKLDLQAAVNGLLALRLVLRRKDMDCKKIRRRKYKWCKDQQKALRKAAPKGRKARKAFLVTVGMKDINARLKIVKKRAGDRKLTCAEQSLAYERLIPDLVQKLREHGAAKEGPGKKDRKPSLAPK